MRFPGVIAPLPSGGSGFSTYGRWAHGANQYGTPKTIEWLIQRSVEWYKVHPKTPFQVGDISLRYGGPMRPHVAHQRGIEIDFRPFRDDGLLGPITWKDQNYSRTLTMEFMVYLRQTNDVQRILFNDSYLIEWGICVPYRDHDNHFHVRLKEAFA